MLYIYINNEFNHKNDDKILIFALLKFEIIFDSILT